ncbi:hypothetical protein PCANC_28189 [Puccinia coronata f. sp. avenae]|uniref:Uncharacterized protein n=1 Tax=Puccinia coronata f. sp. avenae TaxID=200324 RepID=A0A2N5V202_9BASI|nr:hypothetical protein PCANC_28189 [Puccinia coronata f. sp. avenae]PLW43967.1 hypothetical protein PCASD_06462 [Puccinia coronata f. sp. avenae]
MLRLCHQVCLTAACADPKPSAEKKSKARVYCRFLDGTTPAITHPRSVGETGTESSARTTRATSIPASIQIGVPNNSGRLPGLTRTSPECQSTRCCFPTICRLPKRSGLPVRIMNLKTPNPPYPASRHRAQASGTAARAQVQLFSSQASSTVTAINCFPTCFRPGSVVPRQVLRLAYSSFISC